MTGPKIRFSRAFFLSLSLQASRAFAWRYGSDGQTPTTTESFRRDLAQLPFDAAPEHLSVLELGVYRGQTTTFLADLFRSVLAVDVSWSALSAARETIGDKRNVVFVCLDVYGESWYRIGANSIDVVFIDAAHDLTSVKSDIRNSLQLKPNWLLFHDYDDPGVEKAVAEFVAANILICRHTLGETRTHGAQSTSEGIACRVLRENLRRISLWSITPNV